MRETDGKKGQPTLVIAEGSITESREELTFQGSCIRYACNVDCWDGFEEVYELEGCYGDNF